MKNTLLLISLLVSQLFVISVQAAEPSTPVNPEQAKAVAQEKAQAFKQLSPEQRQQKGAEFGAKFRARRAAR